MLKLKSQLTCSNCSRIFKDPILLPCDDSICRGHLSERDVCKANKIKCKACNGEFQFNDDAFRSNKTLRNLIENQSYLSDEESSLKHEIEISIRKFFEFYDEFTQNKNKSESDVFDHFQDMRFQIDEHREESKKRIDDIALAMIDKVKEFEVIYLKSLNEKLSSFDETKSIENEFNQIEETFRDPNLLIETIREMQHKQDESLRDIQIKLYDMSKIKDVLKATNKFQPNLSLFDQSEETSLFGSIKLNEFTNTNQFKSQILKDVKQSFELIRLCEFSPNDKWSLLYRATRDGFGSDDFHSKCDDHANTLTIFKAKQSKFIFGGFTNVNWVGSDEWKSDPNAFIFSLTNKDNLPLKIKIDPNRHDNIILCLSEYGPSFGGGCDIHVANNANTTMDSWSNLGHTYKHPQYEYGTNEAKTFLARSNKFQSDEIEVYQKE
jgi:hypothetical protein